MDKISPALNRRIAAGSGQEPGGPIPVVIQLTAGYDPVRFNQEMLSGKGKPLPIIGAVAGLLTPAELAEIVRREQVKLITADDPLYVLRD